MFEFERRHELLYLTILFAVVLITIITTQKLNRYDKFKLNFYKKVQNGFIKIAKKNINNYRIIDSNLDISFNKKLIIDKIEKLIK